MSDERGPRLESRIIAGTRSYLSVRMLRGARRSAARAAQLEAEHPGDWRDPHVAEHSDHVIMGVLAAAGFMEAFVNEVFQDAADAVGDRPPRIRALDPRALHLMRAWWEESREGFDAVLTKYQLLLSFTGCDRLDRGVEPYQSAKLLIRLRNALAHYRPRTMMPGDEHELERALRGRFELNELMVPESGRTWPNGVLSAGCVTWAADSAEALVDEVVSRTGVMSDHHQLGLP